MPWVMEREKPPDQVLCMNPLVTLGKSLEILGMVLCRECSDHHKGAEEEPDARFRVHNRSHRGVEAPIGTSPNGS